MKLRNKKTGKVTKLDIHCIAGKNYESLAEINEEWEDVSEEEHWYIGDGGDIHKSRIQFRLVHEDEAHKEIGNYFETKEEAEQAVEKLKAWKRLKDKGFRFDKWVNTSAGPYTPIWFYFEKDTLVEDVKSDLDLLFGGEG